MKIARWIAIAAAAGLLVATAAAEAQGQHPAYVRALAELRRARAQLELRPPGRVPDLNMQQAKTQIDKAIQDIADTLDGDANTMPEHALVKVSWSRQESLQRALELLEQARHDIELRQQDSYWKGLKANDAQDHVAAAVSAIQDELQRTQPSSGPHN